VNSDHGHHNDHEHDHREHEHAARISTPEQRELFAPFTDDLHAFLSSALDGITGPIVEVGAGDGVIAQRLRNDGYDIVAIDADAETAAAATEQGREVIHADWRTWDGAGRAPFDAALFTRSLHHIVPIEHGLDPLLRLAPGGLLVADEFGFERVGAPGAQFITDARALVSAAGLNDGDSTASADPLGAWQHWMSHDHEVTPSDRLLEAVAKVADIQAMAHGRFMASMITWGLDPTHPQAAAVRDLVIAIEDARIAAGTMVAGGVRFVGRING